MFRKFLVDGRVTITWQGEELTDKTPSILTAPWYQDVEKEVNNPVPICWETSFDLNLQNRQKITGYACLFEKFDRQHTGLNYFWRKRLIQGNIEPFYRPSVLFGGGNSFRTGRLYIELYCDEMHVTNNKGAIDWSLSKVKEDDLIAALIAQLKSKELRLLQQGENYRNPQAEISKIRIDTGLDHAEDVANKEGKKFIESTIQPSQNTFQPESSLDVIADRVVTHQLDGHKTSFKVACVQGGPRTAWVTIEWGKGADPEHAVLLNLDHPFVQKHLKNETLPIFIGFAVSLLYGEFKSLALLQLGELQLLRQFTDKFLRYMAVTPSIGIDDDTED